MKDARGHGSESRGSLAARGEGPAAHQHKIQGLNTALTGNSWETLGRKKNLATAERIAQYMRIDNRSDLVRIK